MSKASTQVFADEGIRVVRQATVNAVTRDEATGGTIATASVAGGQEVFRASRLLVALGRRPVTEDLNLDAVGVKTGTSGEFVVGSRLSSSNSRISAAGDVTGHREFVYVTAAQGALAVENAFNNAAAEVDYTQLPRVTFTSPAIGAVGMTEQTPARVLGHGGDAQDPACVALCNDLDESTGIAVYRRPGDG